MFVSYHFQSFFDFSSDNLSGLNKYMGNFRNIARRTIEKTESNIIKINNASMTMKRNAKYNSST